MSRFLGIDLGTQSLADDFKVNVEANHATLAGHSFAHELRMCADAGLLGSIDANRGELGLAALRDIAAANGEPASISGRQEWLENLVKQYI